MKTTILAIIKEPKDSKNFIQYMANLAVDLKANVYFLFAQSPIGYPLGITGSADLAYAAVQNNAKTIVDEAGKILAANIDEVKNKMTEDIFLGYSSRVGEVSLLTKELVSEKKVHMVVLEAENTEDFLTAFSSDMEIIRSVDCPVWIVPSDWVYQLFNKIVYATDYKEEDISGLKKLVSLVNHFSPDITALHITDSIDFDERIKKAGFLDFLRKRVSYNKLFLEILDEPNNDDLATLLNEYALLNKADLIVVLKENKSFFKRIFETEQTKKIIEQSKLPVLLFHESTEK